MEPLSLRTRPLATTVRMTPELLADSGWGPSPLARAVGWFDLMRLLEESMQRRGRHPKTGEPLEAITRGDDGEGA